MVKKNNGQLSIQRESALLLSNRTVVGVRAFEFLERPRFNWMWVDEQVAVASLPRTVMDLKAQEDKGKLAMHFMC